MIGENAPPEWTKESFADALAIFFCSSDLSFNLVNNPCLRRLFRMLQPSMTDSDIPHREALRNRTLRLWEKHVEKLTARMKVSV